MIENIKVMLSELNVFASEIITEISTFKFVIKSDAPQQTNSDDCGIFVLMNAVYYSQGKEFKDGSHIQEWRRQFLLDCIAKRLSLSSY